jgi:hypothetical protein
MGLKVSMESRCPQESLACPGRLDRVEIQDNSSGLRVTKEQSEILDHRDRVGSQEFQEAEDPLVSPASSGFTEILENAVEMGSAAFKETRVHKVR